MDLTLTDRELDLIRAALTRTTAHHTMEVIRIENRKRPNFVERDGHALLVDEYAALNRKLQATKDGDRLYRIEDGDGVVLMEGIRSAAEANNGLLVYDPDIVAGLHVGGQTPSLFNDDRYLVRYA